MESDRKPDCYFDAHSPFLKCAINPKGNCDTCKDFKAQELPTTYDLETVFAEERESILHGLYILENRTPIPANDYTAWASWMQANKIVSQTEIGDLLVFTVFLGMDHRSVGDGPPILFETMIFPVDEEDRSFQAKYHDWQNKYKDYQVRYITWDEAERDTT